MAHPPLGLRRPVLGHALGLLFGRLFAWARRASLHALAQALAEERERWFLWLPVATGSGIAAYFALAAEPARWVSLLLLPPVLLLAVLSIRLPGVRPFALGTAALALGFAAAQVRTQQVAAPALERRGAYEVAGRVLLVEEREQGHRLLIGLPLIAGVAPEDTPARVRFSTRVGGEAVNPGDQVRARVLLMPPSAPAAPGDFDFARQAYFERLGAVGYAIGPLEVTGKAEGGSWNAAVVDLQVRIARAIHAASPGASGAIGAALMTGLRAAIPDQVWEDMQASGLVHLLSISGLHLGLVAGTLFFAVRVAIALVPPLALRLPGKKIAAGAALLVAAGYLLLTGATVPTQRAFVMTGMMLLAVMIDRNPFSMRLVAIAALVVLLTQPESLLGASFQMSFAAVVALIALYETGAARRPGAAAGLDRRLLLYLAGITLTTVVASLATAPFSVHHFSRLSTYGTAANLVAIPLTAFWIMPLGLLGILLMPVGLGGFCFAAMGKGIDLMLLVASAMADLPGAAVGIAKPPESALIATVLGGLWLCFWQRPWRRLGLLGPLLGLTLTLLHESPQVLIDASGRLAAVRLAEGDVALAPWERDAWVTDNWVRRFGEDQPVPWPEPGSAVQNLRCDAVGCVLEHAGQTLALARKAGALEEDCARAALVLSYPQIERCPNGTQLIGPRQLKAAGGLALWLEPSGIGIETVSETRGERPWTR